MSIHLTGYKKFMTDQEVRKLLEYVNKETRGSIRIIFHILVYVGLRVSEAVSLKLEYFNGNTITFPLSKSKRTHTRVLPKHVVDMLNTWIRDHYIKKGYLFKPKLSDFFDKRTNNPHIRTSTIGAYLQKFREKYNLLDTYYTKKNGQKLRRISVHTLRHWFMTKLYDSSGKDLLLVADIIGHKKITTTADYIRAYNKWKIEDKLVNQIAADPLESTFT